MIRWDEWIFLLNLTFLASNPAQWIFGVVTIEKKKNWNNGQIYFLFIKHMGRLEYKLSIWW